MEYFDLRSWPFFAQAGGNLSIPAIIEHVSIDSRRIFSPQTLFVALKGQSHDGHTFIGHAAQAGAKYAIVDQSWQPSSPLNLVVLRVPSPLRALQEIAKAYRQQRTRCQVIAIGGSYGKTMLKDLLENILVKQYRVMASPESFNSQIGVPLSLLRIEDSHEIALIEAAFSLPGEMDVLADIISPKHVILTSIGDKHLHTLGSLEVTAQETLKLLTPLTAKSWALIPVTPLLAPHLSHYQTRLLYWPQKEPQLPHAILTGDHPQMTIPYAIHFPDQHLFKGEMTKGFSYFLDLVNIACKSAWLFKVPSEIICETLRDYQPEPMRIEIWKAPTGMQFINEPYSSDPQSIDQALARLQSLAYYEKKTLIFGGLRGSSQQRKLEYRRTGLAIAQYQFNHIILIGTPLDYAPLVQEVPTTTISYYPSVTKALQHLRDATDPRRTVLIKGAEKISLDFLTETYNDSICTNQSIINLAIIESNLHLIRQKLPLHTRLMVIIKALAYGTEDVQIAKFLATCHIDILGVSYVDEGIALKRAGVKQAIFALSATPYEITKILKWDIEIGVGDLNFIQSLATEASRQKKKVKVHLHIDTGMSRFGCRPEEALSLAKTIQAAAPFLTLEGVMTHFACAEDPQEDAFTRQQIEKFDAVIAEIESHDIQIPWKHASNSSGMTRFSLPQYNMARIGLAVYGLFSSRAVRDAFNLKLALSLLSRIVGINMCKQGETISYGRNYTVEKPIQRIGVLPIGYFDGLHRHYSGKGWVLVNGQKAPMIGNICMDFMMIDLTDIPTAQVGDTVLIFGEDEHKNALSPETLAQQGESIVHELVTCIGPRIPRIFIYEES